MTDIIKDYLDAKKALIDHFGLEGYHNFSIQPYDYWSLSDDGDEVAWGDSPDQIGCYIEEVEYSRSKGGSILRTETMTAIKNEGIWIIFNNDNERPHADCCW